MPQTYVFFVPSVRKQNPNFGVVRLVNVRLSSCGQPYGDDHDSTGMEKPTGLSAVQLSWGEVGLFGQIVNRIDED